MITRVLCGGKKNTEELEVPETNVRGAATFATEFQGPGSCQRCHPADINFQAHSPCLR